MEQSGDSLCTLGERVAGQRKVAAWLGWRPSLHFIGPLVRPASLPEAGFPTAKGELEWSGLLV